MVSLDPPHGQPNELVEDKIPVLPSIPPPITSTPRDIAKEGIIAAHMVRFCIEGLVFTQMEAGDTPTLKSTLPNFYDYNAQEETQVTKEGVLAIQIQVLSEMGFSIPESDTTPLTLSDPLSIEVYKKCRAIYTAENVTTVKFDPSLHVDHNLTVEELTKAIPDHVGHGISLNAYKGDALRKSMADEGLQDRRAAKTLWEKWTTVYENPTIENLRKAVIGYWNAGEWRYWMNDVEMAKRGPFQSLVMNWLTHVETCNVLPRGDRFTLSDDPTNPKYPLLQEKLNHVLATLLQVFSEEQYLLIPKG